MELLVGAVQQLFQGAPGSDAQRAANAWLLRLQHSDDAWLVALQVLRADLLAVSSAVPPPDLSVVIVGLQLLRSKVDVQWSSAAHELRADVRQALTQWLHATSPRVASEPALRAAFRLACVTLAALIARDSDATTWSLWRQQCGSDSSLVQTLEVLGALPQQLRSVSPTKDHAQLSALLLDVVSAVGRAFQLESPSLLNRESALRCLESWSVGCLPEVPAFGLTAAHLLESDLLTALLDQVVHLQNEQLCLHSDRDVMQPTLEFWFFVLDRSVLDGHQWELLARAVSTEYLLGVLSRVVNALLQHCCFPAWFVDAQRLPSSNDDGDDEIQDIIRVRREITDTLLSLFSKWPTPGPVQLEFQHRPASCVKGMAELLRSTSDVATLDALLYVFETCVELFDMASTDDSEEDNDDRIGDRSDGSEGTQVMLQVLHDALDLPLHPLLISGVARLFRALSAALVLPGQTYIKVTIAFFRGLEIPSTYAIATEALRHVSHAVTKYTDLSDRHDVLNAAIAACQRSDSTHRQQDEFYPVVVQIVETELSAKLLRAAMTFVGPLQAPWDSPSYRPRGVWQFLFQLLQSPRMSVSYREVA
ncbi:hypothetical protein ATCC90586_007318 [Pythium insidiosum]|nr:hypothetical protein ATCC90586_007318 [Pythium insidiosum]